MNLTIVVHGNPYIVTVGLGDRILNVLEIVLEQDRTHTIDQVKYWELRDEEGNLVKMDGYVSDLRVLGNVKLTLFPKPGVAA